MLDQGFNPGGQSGGGASPAWGGEGNTVLVACGFCDALPPPRRRRAASDAVTDCPAVNGCESRSSRLPPGVARVWRPEQHPEPSAEPVTRCCDAAAWHPCCATCMVRGAGGSRCSRPAARSSRGDERCEFVFPPFLSALDVLSRISTQQSASLHGAQQQQQSNAKLPTYRIGGGGGGPTGELRAACAVTHLPDMWRWAMGAMHPGEAVPKHASMTSSSAARASRPSKEASLPLPSRPAPAPTAASLPSRSSVLGGVPGMGAKCRARRVCLLARPPTLESRDCLANNKAQERQRVGGASARCQVEGEEHEATGRGLCP